MFGINVLEREGLIRMVIIFHHRFHGKPLCWTDDITLNTHPNALDNLKDSCEEKKILLTNLYTGTAAPTFTYLSCPNAMASLRL